MEAIRKARWPCSCAVPMKIKLERSCVTSSRHQGGRVLLRKPGLLQKSASCCKNAKMTGKRGLPVNEFTRRCHFGRGAFAGLDGRPADRRLRDSGEQNQKSGYVLLFS